MALTEATVRKELSEAWWHGARPRQVESHEAPAAARNQPCGLVVLVVVRVVLVVVLVVVRVVVVLVVVVVASLVVVDEELVLLAAKVELAQDERLVPIHMAPPMYS